MKKELEMNKNYVGMGDMIICDFINLRLPNFMIGVVELSPWFGFVIV